MPDEKRFTLAEVREKAADALVAAGRTRGAAEAWARHNIPDPEPPEPERRWVQTARDWETCRGAEGMWWTRRVGGTVVTPAGLTDTYVTTLASLLPRAPVTVTEEMVEKATSAYLSGRGSLVQTGIRAALLAVASDLAQPVHACQHKAEWWGVVDCTGKCLAVRDSAEAKETRKHWDEVYYKAAPHRVVGLAEVDHA